MANNPQHLRPPVTSIAHILTYYANEKKNKSRDTFCFQVGANDGKNNDPVHVFFRDYGWQGLLVEPQTDVFENELKKTYANNLNVKLENVALAESDGELPFYRVAISKARWATGLSSFDLKSLQSHLQSGYIIRKAQDEGVEIPTDEALIIEKVMVPTATVDSLLKRHQVKNFDVLCVDTEGFDYQILKLIDFSRYTPDLILFESKNLSDQDYVDAKNLLLKAGYQLFWEKGDTLAIRFKIPFGISLFFQLKAFIRKL